MKLMTLFAYTCLSVALPVLLAVGIFALPIGSVKTAEACGYYDYTCYDSYGNTYGSYGGYGSYGSGYGTYGALNTYGFGNGYGGYYPSTYSYYPSPTYSYVQYPYGSNFGTTGYTSGYGMGGYGVGGYGMGGGSGFQYTSNRNTNTNVNTNTNNITNTFNPVNNNNANIRITVN
jgi:hypothetical protein